VWKEGVKERTGRRKSTRSYVVDQLTELRMQLVKLQERSGAKGRSNKRKESPKTHDTSPSLSATIYLCDSASDKLLSPGLAAGWNFSLLHVLRRAATPSQNEGESWRWGLRSKRQPCLGCVQPTQCPAVLENTERGRMNGCLCSSNTLLFLSRMGISVLHQRPQLSLPLNWAA